MCKGVLGWALQCDSRHVGLTFDWRLQGAHQRGRAHQPQHRALASSSRWLAFFRSPSHVCTAFARKIRHPTHRNVVYMYGLCPSSCGYYRSISMATFAGQGGRGQNRKANKGENTNEGPSDRSKKKRVGTFVISGTLIEMLGRCTATTIERACMIRASREDPPPQINVCGEHLGRKVNEYMLWSVVRGEVSRSCR